MLTATIADGQLAASATLILAGSSLPSQGTGSNFGARLNMTFCNTGVSSETVALTVLRNGGTARQICSVVLATGERLVISGFGIDQLDTLKGTATDASVVDYLISIASENVPFSMTCYDANGAIKQVNTGISGSQTASGKVTAKSFGTSPKPTDTFAASMTIDVAYGFHAISASNTTSATVTFTPSGAGTAGDFLTIQTATDGTGTVTATFASTFHTTGASGTTQATTLSKFSTITFQSDGTRWLELSRVTAMG